MKALDLGNSPASHGRYLRQRVGFGALVEVVRGTFAALELDVRELAGEAAAMREIIAERDYVAIATLIPRIPCEPDWSRAKNVGLNPNLLEVGLCHPHWSIAVTATKLLEQGAAGPALGELIANVFRYGRGRALRFAAYLAEQAFGADALERAWERLHQGITLGSEHLAQLVIRTAPSDRREDC